MRVGYLGLGLMGGSMAANLVRAGHELTVWNRSAGPTEPLARLGAKVAGTPAEVGGRSEFIFACLPNGVVVRDVLFGPSGALSDGGDVAGKIVIDNSTISPDDARALARDCGSVGVEFLDAPVSGGPEGAVAGNLAVFVGGDEAACARAEPVISAFATTIVRLGESGSGQVAKLANQIVIAANVLGIAEAFKYAAEREVPLDRLLEALLGATANSKMLQTRVPVAGLQPDMPASRDWRPGFRADFMAKDLDFALDDAAGVGRELRTAELVRGLLRLVRADGRADRDWTVFSEYL